MSYRNFVAVLAAVSVISASPIPQDDDTNSISIVGGVPAQAGDFPFIVSLQKSNAHDCGGSLLDSTTVLTAAHCVVSGNADNLSIRAGSLNRDSGGVTSLIASVHLHPDWNSTLIDNDFAILKLGTPVLESSTIKYASLAAAGSDPVANSVATVAGWGNTQNSTESSVNLRKVDVPIVARTECSELYGKNITNNQFCAGYINGGKDSCQGDSGGPIVDSVTGTLIGAVSWGYGCALPRYPGVYARIGTIGTFIDQYL